MKILDPHLKDGVHEWRDGKRFVKEGDKLYLEGTDTLAGRSVSPPLPLPRGRGGSCMGCWAERTAGTTRARRARRS